jgi:hypothetical protein
MESVNHVPLRIQVARYPMWLIITNLCDVVLKLWVINLGVQDSCNKILVFAIYLNWRG